jgi:hypothetical protein
MKKNLKIMLFSTILMMLTGGLVSCEKDPNETEEFSLKGTKWRLVNIIYTNPDKVQELEPKDCEKSWILFFDTDTTGEMRLIFYPDTIFPPLLPDIPGYHQEEHQNVIPFIFPIITENHPPESIRSIPLRMSLEEATFYIGIVCSSSHSVSSNELKFMGKIAPYHPSQPDYIFDYCMTFKQIKP